MFKKPNQCRKVFLNEDFWEYSSIDLRFFFDDLRKS